MREFEDLVRARLGDRARHVGARSDRGDRRPSRRPAPGRAAAGRDRCRRGRDRRGGARAGPRRSPTPSSAVAATGRPPHSPNGCACLPGSCAIFGTPIRLLTTRRGYAAVVVLTLAVGIGACTAVFSLFQALLLGRLPYPEPDRLVLAWETDADDPSRQSIVAAPNYLDWRRSTRSFSGFGIWEYLTFNLAGTTDPEQVQGLRASASLFDVLRVEPALGRRFTPAEDGPGHQVAVISDAVWRTHFAGDRAVRRQADSAERRGPRSDRRDAAGLRVPSQGHRRLDSDRLQRTGPAARLAFVLRGGAARGRRQRSAGARRDRAARQGARRNAPATTSARAPRFSGWTSSGSSTRGGSSWPCRAPSALFC